MRGPKTLTLEQCNRARTTDRVPALANKLDVSEETVYYHRQGRCSHETDIPPRRYETTAEDCATIRRLARQHDTLSEAAKHHDKTRKTFANHATGRCSHDIKTEPIDSPQITQDQCTRFRLEAHEHNRLPDGEFTKPVISTHVNGDCSHEDYIPPWRGNMTQEMCYYVNMLFHDQELDDESVISGLELTYNKRINRKTLRHHVTGNCECWS